MQINHLRSSSVGTFKNCSFQFYLDYVCGLYAPGFSTKTFIGSALHWVAESLAIQKQNGTYDPNSELSSIKRLADIAWTDQVRINSHLEFTKADRKLFDNLVETLINNKYNPLNFNIKDVEKQFEIALDIPGFGDPPCVLRGTIDLIIDIDKETIGINDYKTGLRNDWITGLPKELEHFQKDIQLRIYNLAAKTIYPEYKYRIFTIYYLKDGGPYTVGFDDHDIEETIDTLRRYYNQIRTTVSPKRIKDDKTRYKEHFKCKYVCAYGDKSKDESGVSLCDKFFTMMKNFGLDDAKQKIYDIYVEGKKIDLGPRNNYENPKLFKGKISDIL